MRYESQEMSAISLEVLVPQECPPEVLFPQVSLLVQDGTLPVHLQSKVRRSLIQSVHGHRIVLELTVEVPEVNFKENGIAYSTSQSSGDHPQLFGSKSWHSQCTNPIAEHPAWL